MKSYTHRCPGDGCPICEDRISRLEDERRTGRPAGYTDAELDDLADAEAARFYEEPQ